MKIFCFVFAFVLSFATLLVQAQDSGKVADKPLFRDPIYDGAADPTVIWNPKTKNG